MTHSFVLNLLPSWEKVDTEERGGRKRGPAREPLSRPRSAQPPSPTRGEGKKKYEVEMSDYWFKRKKNLIGAGPATWQAWILIMVCRAKTDGGWRIP